MSNHDQRQNTKGPQLEVRFNDAPMPHMGTLCLIGPAGGGKTKTAVETMPNALFVDIEGVGSSISGIHYVEARTCAKVQDAIRLVARRDSQYEGLILDGIDRLYEMALSESRAHLKDQHNKEPRIVADDGTPANSDVRSQHKVATDWLIRIVTVLQNMPKPVIITGHTKEYETEWTGEGRNRRATAWQIDVALSAQCRRRFAETVDTILFVGPEPDTKSKVIGKRVKRGARSVFAKDRFSRFETTETLTRQLLVRALGLDKPKPVTPGSRPSVDQIERPVVATKDILPIEEFDNYSEPE